MRKCESGDKYCVSHSERGRKRVRVNVRQTENVLDRCYYKRRVREREAEREGDV